MELAIVKVTQGGVNKGWEGIVRFTDDGCAVTPVEVDTFPSGSQFINSNSVDVIENFYPKLTAY